MDEKRLKKIKNRRSGRNRKIAGILCIVLGFEYIIPLIIGIWLIIDSKKKVSMWDKYEELINHEGDTDLSYISEGIGKSLNDVVVDLKVMIEKEFFVGPEGDIEAFVDVENNMLVMHKNGERLKGKGPVLVRLEESLADLEKTIRDNSDIADREEAMELFRGYLKGTVELAKELQSDKLNEDARDRITEVLNLCADDFETVKEKLSLGEGIDDIEEARALRLRLIPDDNGVKDNE